MDIDNNSFNQTKKKSRNSKPLSPKHRKTHLQFNSARMDVILNFAGLATLTRNPIVNLALPLDCQKHTMFRGRASVLHNKQTPTPLKLHKKDSWLMLLMEIQSNLTSLLTVAPRQTCSTINRPLDPTRFSPLQLKQPMANQCHLLDKASSLSQPINNHYPSMAFIALLLLTIFSVLAKSLILAN